MTTHPSFNLLECPWIKVRNLEGAVEEVSLRALFQRLDEFTDLVGESPTQSEAIFRTLLAVFVRGLRWNELFDSGDSPSHVWQSVWNAPDLGELICEYLESCEGRWDLFHPVTPFYQVAGLTTPKGEYPTASVLVPDVGPGLFSTSTQAARQAIPVAEAARWLIYVQAYDVSGIKSGAVGDSRVKGGKGYPIGTGWAGAIGSVHITAPTLKHTLILNMPVHALLADDESIDADLPPWERSPDVPEPRSTEETAPKGVVDVLTWQQRRVRLYPNAAATHVTGALITNGDKIKRSNMFADPTTGYRYSRAQSKNGAEVFFPKTHDPDLTVWRGIQSLFVHDVADEVRDRDPIVIQQIRRDLEDVVSSACQGMDTKIRLTGMSYGTQDAVVEREISETYPVRVQLLSSNARELRAAAVDVIKRVMSFRNDLSWFHKQLMVSAGASPMEVPTAPVQEWLSAMEGQFLQWLEHLAAQPSAEAAESDWATRMWRVSRQFIADALVAAGPRAAIGRTEVNDKGTVIIHSSAKYEVWILKRLRESLEGALVTS